MNPDLFGRPVEKMIANQKAKNVAFVEAMQGLTSDLDVLTGFFDSDRANASLRRFFAQQVERSTLRESRARLIVMDSYSDMNFKSYRHRKDGWRAWFNVKYLKNRRKFHDTFEMIGYRTLHEALADNVAVIEHYRRMNGEIPVWYLSQPTSFYRKLDHRQEFAALGALLEEAVPGVFWSGNMDVKDLQPADMDSCGPGQTLHFAAETYAEMFRRAAQKGLASALAQTSVKAESRGTQPSQTHGDTKHDVEVPALPEVSACLQFGAATCSATCETRDLPIAERTLLNYARFEPPQPGATKRMHPSVMALAQFADAAAHQQSVKRSTSKPGLRTRLAARARGLGFYVKPFPSKLHLPDIVEINTSKEARSGGAMREQYKLSVGDLGGVPAARPVLAAPPCATHWQAHWGVFLHAEGHCQGAHRTDEKLYGYIALRRWGDLLLYTKLMGHGQYLQDGIMVLLHHEIIGWLLARDSRETEGITHVMYGALEHAPGTDGLRDWKRRELFTPVNLALTRMVEDRCVEGPAPDQASVVAAG